MTVDRRQAKPRSFIAVGMMIGLFLANPISVISQGSNMTVQEWTAPPVLLSLLGIVLSVGMAWQMLQEYRRRLAMLEQTAVRREIFDETMKRIDGSLDKLHQHAIDIRRELTEGKGRRHA